MNWAQIVLIAAFVVMTVVGIVIMYVDKKKAKEGKWRIKEATLFAVAILFGGVGTTIGMYAFRHKTKHWYFAVFFPIFALIDIAALAVGLYFLHGLL
ncbi:MAG: DUF1294 domain-containing protein [Clostridia bacterium]|nr:DUF1294 domain-containing protein [Clostridia bacterium]